MRDDDESAFPYEDIRYRGMSLRDYFAAKAMNAQLMIAIAKPGALGAKDAEHSFAQYIAYNAYKIADAMLAERCQ